MRGTDLIRPFRGVYLPTSVQPTLENLCRALAQRLPDDAFFCGITAARLIAVPLSTRHERSSTVHVGVYSPDFPPKGRGLCGHFYELASSDVRVWNGVRITSPERTWCDLGAVLSLPDVVAAGDYLVHRRLPITTIEALASAISNHSGRRGVRRLRQAHPLLNTRSESRQESRLRVIVVTAGLSGLEANFPITTSGGFNYRADLAFPERKLIVEYQSAFHETPARFRADMTRISRLEADGWRVMQINADDLDDPIELVARIRHMLARG